MMDTSEQLQRLAALAAGLCQDAGVGLEVTRSPEWVWDPIRRVMVVAGPDLEQRGPEFCTGVLAHEVGHYYISRHGWFSVNFPLVSVLRYVMNGLEDGRVNTWMRRRYPGSDPWLKRVAELEWSQPDDEPLPKVIEFARECAREAWLGWSPAPPGAVAPEVAAALRRRPAACRPRSGCVRPRPGPAVSR
jgi:hypothetical protein